MGLYGKNWRIDGVTAGIINRDISVNGRYFVTFERAYATLEQIEAINWAAPVVEAVGAAQNKPVLPEGYGFTVENIQYENSTKCYCVVLKVASQYLGDVSGYQEQIGELQAAAAEKDSTIEEQAAQIEEQTRTIETLTQAGSAAELEAELDAAYQEGVDSVE